MTSQIAMAVELTRTALVILVWKPKPYEVDIVSRGPGYAQLVRQTPGEDNTGVLSFDDVMETTA